VKPAAAAALVFFLAARSYGSEELQNIIVKPGDTLWSISSVYLKDPTKWHQFLKYNRLPSSDPSLALPGMTLKVPVNLVKEQYRAAKLVYFINNVLLRKSGAADWAAVVMSMDLFKSDTLRTTVDARADVKFYTGEILNLYPNSIAVLRPPDKKADVELLSGEMRGVRSRVITASARITPRTKDTEFQARIKDDLSTLVQVYKGRAAVEAQGRVVEVSEGFASEVKMDMPPSQPVKLPPLPEFRESGRPKPGKTGAPQIKMEGNVLSLDLKRPAKTAAGEGERLQVPGAEAKSAPGIGDLNDKEADSGELTKLISVANAVQAYRLQVSRDQNFAGIALDRQYDAFDTIDLTDLLPPGNYWMRVSYIDLLGFEGKFNSARRITVGRKRY
jgi:hypothetical protein